MVPAATPRRRSARERLLDTADRLFYQEGVHGVGIDRVLEQSGVAKGSLYYNFGGKDDLVRTYLQNRHAQAGYRRAGKLTAQLVVLYDGANISAQLDRNPAVAGVARDAAAGLLSLAARP